MPKAWRMTTRPSRITTTLAPGTAEPAYAAKRSSTVTRGSLPLPVAHEAHSASIRLWRRRTTRPRSPALADGELLLMAHEGHPQQQRFQAELLQPALVAENRGAEAELSETARLAIHERRHAEFLCEAPQLADRRGALVQVHEMHL